MAAALVVLAAMLGTASIVNSTTFNVNPGPRLVASASVVPPQIAALQY